MAGYLGKRPIMFYLFEMDDPNPGPDPNVVGAVPRNHHA